MFRTVFPFAALALLAMLQPPSLVAQGKASAPAAAKPAAATVVNLNAATAAELEGLPGIGAKTAARIVEYRQKNGPFKKVEDVMNVRGVGEKNFLKLKPQLSVAAVKSEHEQQPPR